MKKIMRGFLGLLFFCGGLFLLLSCCFYNATDASFNTATTTQTHNLLGYTGACASDMLIQLFGGMAFFVPVECLMLSLMLWGKTRWISMRFVLFLIALSGGCFLLSLKALSQTSEMSVWLNGGFWGYFLTQFIPVPNAWIQMLAWGITGVLMIFALKIPFLNILRWGKKNAQNIKLPQNAITLLENVIPTPHFSLKPQQETSSVLAQTIPADESFAEKPKKKLFAKKQPEQPTQRIEPSFDGFGGLNIFNAQPSVAPATQEKEETPVKSASSFIQSFMGSTHASEEQEETPAKSTSSFIQSFMGATHTAEEKKPQQPLLAPKSSDHIPPVTGISDIVLPTSDLLRPVEKKTGVGMTKEALEMTARNLEKCLAEFRITGKVIGAHPGPVVTLYEYQIGEGIRFSRVIALEIETAMRLAVPSVRMASISGVNAVGVEVPNKIREIVYMRELIEDQSFKNNKDILPIVLGKDIAGNPVLADLAEMPHLLIAGTTGSGKSVGINAIIVSLLYRFTPEQCRLIMVDPKVVELSIYNRIPHLLTPVVTEPTKAVAALKWAVREMEDRYRALSNLNVRNIESYNQKLRQASKEGLTLSRKVQTGFDPQTGHPIFEEQDFDLTPLPYIVIIIDEMADLMMQCGKEAEPEIQRLAQKARAVGIHLILATQRPSVDIITGVIKSNFPSRISFQVRTRTDSRTILDMNGAEQLLGKGDMIFMSSRKPAMRVHAPLVTDSDVENVVHHWEMQAEPQYLDAVVAEQDEGMDSTSGSLSGMETGGDLYDQAVAIVLRDKKPTISYIQRQLRIGYNKAADLIDRMEAEGILSKPNVAGKRDILVPTDNA